ncbi:MAG: hypothetical protein Q9169_004460 [Polycauliona sp. 2 TL-2023]
MHSIKSTASPPPHPATAHPETPPSQPSSSPSTAPFTSGSRKRKLDVEDDGTRKRQQVELQAVAPPASPPISPPASQPAAASPQPLKASPETRQNTPDHNREAEDIDRSRDGEIPAVVAKHEPQAPVDEANPSSPTLRNSQEREADSRYRDETGRRYHATDNRSHEAKDSPSTRPQPSPTAQLSKANLKQLQQQVIALEEMNNTATSSERGRKRTLSGQMTMSRTSVSEVASTRTKESTPSHAFYRYEILDQAKVYVIAEDPPRTVQAQLDTIFKREMSEERHRQISATAKEKSPLFSELLRGAHREDDLVELVHEAIFAMHKDKALTHPRKADWNLCLKPTIQRQQYWNFDLLDRPNAGVDEGLNGPDKLQETDQPVSAPGASQSPMPPPPVLRAQPQPIQDAAVKTPRPDFTCGFRTSTVTNALHARGLSKFKAHNFLEALQLKSKLYSNPAQQSLEVRFPILVVEGKAYATGKTLFEAENQAAVSGSSMLILQQQLEVLHDTVVLGSSVERKKSPLAFSVCTQGPNLELWAHYIVTEESTTTYHMNIVASCHACLSGELERFLTKTDCMIQWYKSEYLAEVVDQLFVIANHAAR